MDSGYGFALLFLFLNVPAMPEAMPAILSTFASRHRTDIVPDSVRLFNVPAMLESIMALLSVCLRTHNGHRDGLWSWWHYLIPEISA